MLIIISFKFKISINAANISISSRDRFDLYKTFSTLSHYLLPIKNRFDARENEKWYNIFNYLFWNLFPSFSKSINRTVNECCTNLKNPIKVVDATTNVCYCSPLLYASYPFCHCLPPDYFRYHQSAGLFTKIIILLRNFL